MSNSLDASRSWRLLDSFEASTRTLLESSIRELVRTHPQANLDHDIDWLRLRADGQGRKTLVYILLDGSGELCGYAPFFVHPSSLSFEYAAKTILSIRTCRHAITAQPLLREDADPAAGSISLLLALRPALAGPDVLFGLGVPLDEGFGRAILSQQVLTKYLLMPHGPEYARRLLRLPENLEAYLSGLGPKSRADLRRHERKLTKAAHEDVRVTVHTAPDSVADFVRHAAVVSKLTYQWHMHQLGIDDTPATVQRYTAIAAGGWLRCYLLFAQDTPIAFMVGYLFRGIYYSETIGYDPKWAEHSVGNVLHMHVVRDLTALTPKVQWFDFLYGDNSNKQRLSTDSRQERSFYLVPRTLRWTVVVSALRGFDAITGWINDALERHGVKDKLKRWLRRRATGVA